MNQKQKEQIRELSRLRTQAYISVLAEMAQKIAEDGVNSSLRLCKNPKRLDNVRTPEEITTKVLQNYLEGLNKGGTTCVERIIRNNGDGTYTFTTEQRFVPWLNDMTQNTADAIISYIGEAESAGEYPLDTARKLKSVFEGTRHRAVTAARTEAQKIRTDARFETFADQGVKYVQYVTVGDGKVRPEHRARDGKIYRIEDAPYLGEYNCRCTVTPADYKVRLQGAPVEPSDAITLTEEQIAGQQPVIPSATTTSKVYSKGEEPVKKYGEYGEVMDDEQFSSICSTLTKIIPDAEIDNSLKALDYKVLRGSLKTMEAISKTSEGSRALSTINTITTTKRNDIIMGVSLNKSGEIELQYSLAHYTPNMIKSSADTLRANAGLLAKGTTLESAVSHESGHLQYIEHLFKHYKGEKKAIYDDWVKASTKINDTYSVSKKEEIAKRWKETRAYQILSKAGVVSNTGKISRYALETPSEAIAEAVADVLQNKEAAQEVSKKIYNVLIENIFD